MELGQRVIDYSRCQNQVWDLTCSHPKSEQFNIIARRMAYTPKRRVSDRSTFLCLRWWYFSYFPSWGRGRSWDLKGVQMTDLYGFFFFFFPFCIQKTQQHALNETNALMLFPLLWLYNVRLVVVHKYKADDD